MKFKEIFKKIKSKKYCLTALLLASLLIFAVLGGLNQSKSGKNKSYAATAPAVKNLDLNGVRYTYQTSLKDLKNNYNILNLKYDESFRLVENGEGVITGYFGSLEVGNNFSEESLERTRIQIQNAIQIEYDGDLKNSSIKVETDSNLNRENTYFDFTEAPMQSNITGININYELLYTLPFSSNPSRTQCSVTVQYLKNGLSNNIKNSIYKTYAVTQYMPSMYYKFDKIDGYDVRGLFFNYANGIVDDNEILFVLPNNYATTEDILKSSSDFSVVIDTLDFSNLNNNIISFNTEFDTEYDGYTIFKGNILLSQDKVDEQILNYVNSVSIPANKVIQDFSTTVFFGGANSPSKIGTSSIVYHGEPVTTRIMLVSVPGAYPTPINKLGLFECIKYNNKIFVNYYNQNQLLFLEKMDTLRLENYAGLSAQVEDILYNVNYVGDIEDIEFNQKVEEDLNNLLKTVGLGAFVGLLIGLAFGNPLLGAAIGAAIGFAVAIIPLIIDGLQAIFGKQFLTGLYNFFKSIAEFFANFVDTIINFLMSIITNPFVLVFIVIAAIIFLIFYFKNK